MSAPDARFDTQPTANNHFAWMRTQMALQRTLMASVRTSVSLIGFGFTVAQFFQKILHNVPDDIRHIGPEAPRNLGLTLIAAGVVSLAVFTWQYGRVSEYLRTGEFRVVAGAEGGARPLHTSTYLIAFTVMAIGVAAFASVFLRF